MRQKITYPILLTLLTLPFFLTAQTLNLDHFKTKSPRNIGPAGMSGRVTSIDVVLSNPEVIYVGTASGGVWRSKSGGIDWEPIFDEMPVASIGSVKVNQNNPTRYGSGQARGIPVTRRTVESVFIKP